MFDILLKNMIMVATSDEIIGNYIVLNPNDKTLSTLPYPHTFISTKI